MKVLTGDEEIVKAFLINRLVNELDYQPQNIETEKEYTIKGGHSRIKPKIDAQKEIDKQIEKNKMRLVS